MNKQLFLLSISLLAGFMICGTFSNAMAAEGIVVSDIKPVYVEKGATNVSVTMKAIVTNNTEAQNVVIEISGLDKDGYVVENITLTGKVKMGKKRVVMKMVTMQKNKYEKIVSWEEKK
ncbi:MAG: hypothetical protein GXP53_09555 [Deltaproteobacteria bacterium]|nr:hypothetical protein [Deltaproteobacteria bacterium]